MRWAPAPPGLVHERALVAGRMAPSRKARTRTQSAPGRHQQVAGAAPYPNLKSAETRLDKLTWLSAIVSVASSLIMTSDPACDIALVSVA